MRKIPTLFIRDPDDMSLRKSNSPDVVAFQKAYLKQSTSRRWFGKQYAHPLDELDRLIDDVKRYLWLGRYSRRARIRALERDLWETYAVVWGHVRPEEGRR